MKKLLTLFLLIAASVCNAQTDNYRKAWAALGQNDRTEATRLLQQAMQGEHAADAYITNIYLSYYNGAEKKITDFGPAFMDGASNPYPYLYSLWFNNATLGGYGALMNNAQEKLLGKILSDTKLPGSLRAAANYRKISQLVSRAERPWIDTYLREIGQVENWQFVGPFENLSGSGYYKDFGPLAHPEPDAVFKSATGADIKWFTPAYQTAEGWTMINSFIVDQTATIYAQSFVKSPADMHVICNAGFSGAIKVWVNDELVLNEPKELFTELDYLSAHYHLKKGTNRVLVQLSYSGKPNPFFNVRFTNDQYLPIPELVDSAVYTSYPDRPNGNQKYQLIPHFAETYFKNKIKEDSSNLINYLLLSDFYIRNQVVEEARNTINLALNRSPENCLLHSRLMQILLLGTDKTLYSQELEKLRSLDPHSLLALTLDAREAYQSKKYEQSEELLNKIISLYGEDENTADLQIALLIADQKYDELVKLIEKLYKIYPENKVVVEMMYNVKMNVYQDNKAALSVFEVYTKKNFDSDIYNKYSTALIESGDTKKGLDVRDRAIKLFPYASADKYNMAKYYFGTKQYDKAKKYTEAAKKLSPYTEAIWELEGDIEREQKRNDAALAAYNRSLELQPNQYSVIGKVRKMNGLPEISTLFENVDVLEEIAKDNPQNAKNVDYGSYYILDKTDVTLYPGGAHEMFVTYLIRITNDKGIERYQETDIGYGRNEVLQIEKAQVIKNGRTRIDGDLNDNQIVFTNLQAGDVVYLRYRIQSYSSGRLGKEFWDKHHFTGQIYSSKVLYELLVPENQTVKYVLTNNDLQPEISKVEDFKRYKWELVNGPVLANEPLMPLMIDVAAVLHVSTVDAWSEVANWYSDALTNKMEENLELTSLYNGLFAGMKNSLSDFEKAKIIYDYIANNIKYSSVPFRQGPLVPQRASTTINTRLGDCKDLSNLFVTLAHMAGLRSQMVLVDTRDNGRNDIMLPSMDFNHCIAKAVLDDKAYYIELTDNFLPFTSLPNSLNGAAILEIPSKSMSAESVIKQLKSDSRVRDMVKRVIDIRPDGDDLKVEIHTTSSGALSSIIRDQYRNTSEENQRQNMEQTIGSFYRNTMKLERLKFDNLDQLDNTVSFVTAYTVKNEVSEIGSMKAFKIVYPDIVATLDNFSADSRSFPIEYWSYENTDEYLTEVNIIAPGKAEFADVPADENLSFGNMKYSITYQKIAPGKLKVIRHFTNDRPGVIMPSDYKEFKSFFENILKAEQKFIVFKS